MAKRAWSAVAPHVAPQAAQRPEGSGAAEGRSDASNDRAISDVPAVGTRAATRRAAHLSAHFSYVFFVGTDGGLWTSTWSAAAGHWATWEISGTKGAGLHGAPVSAVSRQPGSLDVVFEGPGRAR
jgi:hypothetical protein